MSNRQELIQAFATALTIPAGEVVDTLSYQGVPQWDSVAHMALVTELETVFDVMLDTDEILALSSVAKTREILAAHGIAF